MRSKVCIVCHLEKRDYCFSKWQRICKPCRSKLEVKRQRLPHVKELRKLWKRHRYVYSPGFAEKCRAEAKRIYWRTKERREAQVLDMPGLRVAR